MITTHEEAVTKKCCTLDRSCQGKDCMAWREEVVEQEVLKEYPGGSRIISVPELTGKGYCGLVYR